MTNKKCCMKTSEEMSQPVKCWRSSPPSLFQEMQKTFNSYKCLMISVNLSSRHFLRGDSAELQELQEALASANHSWTQACGGLESWERRLHSALMQCQVRHLHQRHNGDLTPTFKWKEFRDEWPLTSDLCALLLLQEFHETLHSLLLWLAQAENKLNAVNVSGLSTPRSVLMEHRDTLTVRTRIIDRRLLYTASFSAQSVMSNDPSAYLFAVSWCWN